MKILKSFLKRLFIVAIPILALYYYSEMAFEANRQKEHPTDVGLGIAVFLFLILFFLFLGFTIDTIIRFLKNEYKTAMINVIFLLPFLFLILYIGCLFFGGDCFCEFITNLNEKHFIYLIIISLALISFGFLIVYKCSLKIIMIYLIILSSIGGGHFYNKYNIEDYYGENKDMYFEGNINDTIMIYGSDKMSVLAEGQIERKTWNRIYIKTDKNTVELNNWQKLIAKKFSDNVKCELTKHYR